MAKTQGPLVNSVAIAFAVITFFASVLRIWARARIANCMGADDSVRHGLGSHYADVVERGTQNMVDYSQIVWLSSIFYNACLGFIKISVLALYTRLGNPRLRRVAFIMIGVVGLQAGAYVLVCIFQCTPISAAYDITIRPEDKKCIDINAFYLASAALNIVTDAITPALPIPLIVELQMSRERKIGLGITLGLGFLSADQTWVISGAMYWSVIETNIGILAASIPSYRVIAKRYVPRLFPTSDMSGSKHSHLHSIPLGPVHVGPGAGTITTSIQSKKVHKASHDNSSKDRLVDSDSNITVITAFTHQSRNASGA
ncbi:hypothetical protein FDECE_7532 [Fusarium decemcellulare]|nr:hypothetical protein FDECE_7532 [Fusarium decemcellulare]